MTATPTTLDRLIADEITFEQACDLLADQCEAEEKAEAARVAKLAELDGLIESLHADLDATPDRSWQSAGARFRLSLLIAYTARRHLLSLAS